MKFEDRESPVDATRRVPRDWDVENKLDPMHATAKAVEDAIGTDVALTDQPVFTPQVMPISPHENVLIYFNQEVENFGAVRIETCRDGISFFVGSICVWRSFQK